MSSAAKASSAKTDKSRASATRAPAAPASVGPISDSPDLVSAVGNQAALRLLDLRVGSPRDPLEKEADRVAHVASAGPGPSSKPPTIRGTAFGSTVAAPADFGDALAGSRHDGDPLPSDTRRSMEARIGHDFSDVHIHDNTQADYLNQNLQSRAFTVGNDIYFAARQFAPGSAAGQRLLAHELTHVVQQSTTTSLVIARQPTDTGTDLQSIGIDARSFNEIWAEFDRLQILGRDAEALALTPTLVARMGVKEALDHAAALAVWLIHHDDRERAVLALDALESALWVSYATGAPSLTPSWANFGLSVSVDDLVSEGENEAKTSHHETGRRLLGVAHLMVQMTLADYYEKRRKSVEQAASLGEAGQMVIDISRITEGGEVERLTALRTRILNVYPRLAAEQRRAGDSATATALASEGKTLAADLASRYALADLPDVSNLSIPVGRATATPPRAEPSGTRPTIAPIASQPATTTPQSTQTEPAKPPSIGPDKVVNEPPPFQGATALALHGNHYVRVDSERYAVSEVLMRATAWAQNLFGVNSSIVVAHVDADNVIRYYAAALDEDLTETFPTANPLSLVLVDVMVRLERLPQHYDIMLIHVGNGIGFWPSPERLKAYEKLTARERKLPTEATHLTPALVRANVFSRIDELMVDEDKNLEEIARLLSQLDATAFATLDSAGRLNYLRVLINAWTFQKQERAIVEIVRSIEGEIEFEAVIARLKKEELWSHLINDLDHELWSLLMTVGERFGKDTLTVRDVYQIMAENGLLQVDTPIPGLSVGPNGVEFSLDVIANIQEAAAGFLRFMEGIWDAIVMLVTHPDKIVEGLAQLTKMIFIFKLAELGYPQAMEMRDQVLAGFGKQLVNGFKGMGVLGVGKEVIRRLKWAIIWEVASFFIGVGEIKAAMEAVGVSARVGAIARFLRLLGLAGKLAEAEEATATLARLANILSKSSRALRTEEEVLVGLSHLPDTEVTRLGKLLEGRQLQEGMTLAQLRQLHPELAEAAEASLKRAEIVSELATKAGGFSDDLAKAFARLSNAGHTTEDLARIISHIPKGEGQRFMRVLGMISDDAALVGPRGVATLELLGQSATRMQAVERFGFRAIDSLMEHMGRDAATVDGYLAALGAIERELPEAKRATEMQKLLEAVGNGDADALARLDDKAAKLSPEFAMRQWARYQEMNDLELFARYVDRGDETAAAVIRQRYPSNEAALKKILGSEYRPPHSATVIHRRAGQEIERKTLNSGNMTAEEKALGFPKNMLATHTEARAVSKADLKAGDIMEIRGQYDPCGSCQRAMQAAANNSGATIRYWWPGGGTVEFTPAALVAP